MKITYSLEIPTNTGIKYFDEVIGNKCCGELKNIMIEKVLHDLYEVGEFETKEKAIEAIEELRKNKVYKPIFLTENTWITENYVNTQDSAIYITSYDDDLCIEYDCLKNRSILELIEEFPEIELIKER